MVPLLNNDSPEERQIYFFDDVYKSLKDPKNCSPKFTKLQFGFQENRFL